MPTYNGLLCSLTKDGAQGVTTFLNGISTVFPVNAVPQKFFNHVELAIALFNGVSGGFTVSVVGAVGGATYIVAERQNLSAVGSFPIPLIVYGRSGSDPSLGIPRPWGVQFNAPVTGQSNVGFTASVFIAGEY